jgi:hypothetical protein
MGDAHEAVPLGYCVRVAIPCCITHPHFLTLLGQLMKEVPSAPCWRHVQNPFALCSSGETLLQRRVRAPYIASEHFARICISYVCNWSRRWLAVFCIARIEPYHCT